MNDTNENIIESDSEILGSLPQDIKEATIIHTPMQPDEYESLVEELKNMKFNEVQPESSAAVVEYVIIKKPARKRVPRLWWGWTIKIYKLLHGMDLNEKLLVSALMLVILCQFLL